MGLRPIREGRSRGFTIRISAMATGNRVCVFYVTKRGGALARRLTGLYPDLKAVKFTKKAVQDAWIEGGTLLFIMAAAIAVRTLAPLIKDKKSDPAVIVLDESGRAWEPSWSGRRRWGMSPSPWPKWNGPTTEELRDNRTGKGAGGDASAWSAQVPETWSS